MVSCHFILGFIFLKVLGNVDKNGDGFPNENESFSYEVGTNELFMNLIFPISNSTLVNKDTFFCDIELSTLFNSIDFQTEDNTNSVNFPGLALRIRDNFVNSIQLIK